MYVWIMAGLLVLGGTANAPQKAQGKKEAPKYRVSGPYQHKNLSVFLIHGDNQVEGKSFVTLDEAIAAKKVVVHETGTVSELAIENVSDDQVYVQAGDIVKGGRQDRVLTVDVIMPAHSGKLPVKSFCVEQGRWSKRGGESADKFDSAKRAVSSKKLKIAFREKSQGDVWNTVAEEQAKLQKATGKNVKGASGTSYQLTLDSKAVKEATDEYIAALKKSAKVEDDVIGYAFAINGEVNSADVYANNILFAKLWPKLLRASVVEAVGEHDGKKSYKEVRTKDVEKVLATDAAKPKGARKINDLTEMKSGETDETLIYETTSDEETVHKSIILK